MTDGARRERHVSSLVSRVSRLRRSRVRALLSLNPKKKRDYSQSMYAKDTLGTKTVIQLDLNASQEEAKKPFKCIGGCELIEVTDIRGI